MLWDLQTGRELQRLLGHEQPVLSVAISPDGGHAVSGSLDHTFRLWDLRAGKQLGVRQLEANVLSVALSPDGRQALVGLETWKESQNLFLVSLDAALRNGRELAFTPLRGHWSEVRAVAFSPTERLVATAGGDRHVTLWSLDALAPTRPLIGHASAVWTVAVGPTGNVASGGDDGAVRLWTRGSRDSRWTQGDENGFGVAFTPEGDVLTSGNWDDFALHLRDAATGHLTRGLMGHTAAVHVVAVSADGRAASAADDGVARVWSLDKGAELGKLDRKKGEGVVLAFALDGRHVLVGGDEILCLWDTVDKEVDLGEQHGRINAVALSADGTQAITAGETPELQAWRLEDRTARPMKSHTKVVRSLAFSSDSTRALSAAPDKVVLWDMKTLEPLEEIGLGAKADSPMAVAFDPDGRSFVVGTARGVVLLYTIVGP